MTAKTNTKRSEEFRARQKAQNLHEVRGIYLPLDLHKAIKIEAKWLAKQMQKKHQQISKQE